MDFGRPKDDGSEVGFAKHEVNSAEEVKEAARAVQELPDLFNS
jgi:hypothetical protein